MTGLGAKNCVLLLIRTATEGMFVTPTLCPICFSYCRCHFTNRLPI